MVVTWYSVKIETADSDGGWSALTWPCTEVSEYSARKLAHVKARIWDLDEASRPWRVLVYAGYNQYADLLAELTGGKEEV